MNRILLAIAVALAMLLTLMAVVAAAQGSVTTVNFQGELADSSGNPLDGSYNMRFAIYDTSGGGNRIWPAAASYEQHNAVSVDAGLFNVLLGSGGYPLSATSFSGGDRYLQVWVCETAGAGCSSYQALTPRQPIASVAYALTANTLVPDALIVNNSGRGLTVETGSGSDYGTAIYGHAASDSGQTVGVWGTTESDNDGAMGVLGQAGGPGQTYGVYGQTTSPHADAAGVYGEALASSGRTYGVYGETGSSSANASGVYGVSTQGATNGVWGETTSSADSASGVYGLASAGSGHTYGVYGRNTSTAGTGIYGEAAATTGKTHGIYGVTQSTGEQATGVYGLALKSAGKTYGVQGATNSSTDDASGMFGQAYAETGQVYGVQGWTTSGTDKAAGVYGRAVSTTGEVVGVYGKSDSPEGYGIYSEGSARVDGDLSVEGRLSAQTVSADRLWGHFRYGFDDPALKDAIHVFSTDPVGHAAYLELRSSESYTPVVTVRNSGGGGGLDAWVFPNEILCPDCLRPSPAAVRGFNFGSVGSAAYFESSGSAPNHAPAVWVSTWNPGDALFVWTSGEGWAGNFYGAEKGIQIEVPEGKPGLEVIGGTKSAVVETSHGTRALYSEEATEVWFSDYGFGRLKDGQATVHIDTLFAETVNLDQPYHVFVQAYGDAELYVMERTPTSFQVRRRPGDPDVEFSYRIVGKRRGYEATRLEPRETGHTAPKGMPGGE